LCYGSCGLQPLLHLIQSNHTCWPALALALALALAAAAAAALALAALAAAAAAAAAAAVRCCSEISVCCYPQKLHEQRLDRSGS
jgi:hypothetical protein